MKRKILAGLLLLSITASSFSNLGYVPVNAAEYEDNVVVTKETTSFLDGITVESELVKKTVEDKEDILSLGDIIASGEYDTWEWTLDEDGILLIDGIISKPADGWPWKSRASGYKIKEAKITGSGMGSLSEMFHRCDGLTSLDVSDFDTSKVTNMSYMFSDCYSLTSLDLSSFNTQNVTNMSYMFYSCCSLTSLDLSSFNTKNVTNMSHMFQCYNAISSLTSVDISNFNTSNITDMSYMFSGCGSLTSLDVSIFDTSKVTNMSYMFEWCFKAAILGVSSFDTSKVTDMRYMFCGCSNITNLDLSSFDTGKVTDMTGMFYRCVGLENLDISNFNTKSVTTMGAMFYDCSSITNLDLSSFDTSKVTDMRFMFCGCSNITNLDLSNFNTSNVTSMIYIFDSCNSLKEVKSPYNISVEAELPSRGIWVDESGMEVTIMHQNLANSVTYTRNSFVYSICFVGNGATSGSMSNLFCEPDIAYTLPANKFNRTGFFFNGWNTVADGSGNAYTDKTEVINLATKNGDTTTLYAQWKPISYTIHFDKNGAKSGDMTRIFSKYGVYYMLPSCGFSKSGYAFAGWNTKKNGKGKTYKNRASVKNLTTVNGKTITLYAQWKKVKVAQAGKPTLKNTASNKLIVTCKRVTGAKGYEIQYATNKGMKKGKKVYVSGTKKTIKGLKKGTTYYVRVRAYKVDSAGKKIYGKYSKVQHKKITK